MEEAEAQQLANVPTASTPKTSVVKMVRNVPICQVNGFTFNFIHRLEGNWSGESNQVKSSQGDFSLANCNAASTKVRFHSEGYWTLRETSAGVDGVAAVMHIKLIPVWNGILAVDAVADRDSTHPMDYSQCALTVTETPYGAHLVGHNLVSGQLVLFQIISITPNGDMERTSMTYNNGEMSSLSIIREKRIV